MKNDVSNSATSNKKEAYLWKIWEQLNKNRELEISTQWQRVIFLSSFIILTLSGNSILFFEVFCSKNPTPLSLTVALSGIILSLLLLLGGSMWLAMTKGSKYWMNVYERKIDLIEQELNFQENYKQFRYLEEKYTGPELQSAADGRSYCVNKNLVSTSNMPLSADTTSPSKTNILIGWIIVFCSVFFSVKYFIYLIDIENIKKFITCDVSCKIFTLFVNLACYYIISFLVLILLKHNTKK
ncbi:MAG: hypothetical protein E7052_09010 [Lentisphaerae bacterium]|nr:hypothetical protein [Lentisphaerota bacterium]